MANKQRREQAPNSKKTRQEITAKRFPKKIFVFEAGRRQKRGSISEMATRSKTTENNIVMHIQQCHTICGYGYKYKDDWYEITG